MTPNPARPQLNAEPWDEAARRFDYQLSFRRSPRPRTIADEGFVLTGDPIDNAYLGLPQNQDDLRAGFERPAQAAGSWEDFDGPLASETGRELADPGPEDWLRKYIEMALQEAVHEALEWIRVDGQLWLNPHKQGGHADIDIAAIVRGMAAELFEIRQRRETAP